MSKFEITLTVILAIIVFGVGSYFIWPSFYTNLFGTSLNGVVCTQEAKLCPDGSYVSRIGPNCEFAACPTMSGWKTITFEYPPSFGQNYATAQFWPPTVAINQGTYFCAPGTNGSTQQVTTEKTVGSTKFCITSTSEGAAGSVYTMYSYLYASGANLINIGLTIQYPQCDNYPDPQMTSCKSERANFDLDSLIVNIASTISAK